MPLSLASMALIRVGSFRPQAASGRIVPSAECGHHFMREILEAARLPMRRERNGLAVTVLVALVALSGCAPRPAGTVPPAAAAAVADSGEAARAERAVTLSSGATLKMAVDWTVSESKDGLTLEDPEKQLRTSRAFASSAMA